MKYWLIAQASEGLQVFAEQTLINYKINSIKVNTQGKNGKVQGTLNDDFPLFLSLNEPVFSTKLMSVLNEADLEGIHTRQISLEFSNKIENNNFYEITVSPCVDCIDFKNSELKLRQNGSIQRMRKLVVDEEKADRAGYDIFRLHGRFTSIVVSDRIKQAIESVNPTGIRFEPTDGSDPDWY